MIITTHFNVNELSRLKNLNITCYLPLASLEYGIHPNLTVSQYYFEAMEVLGNVLYRHIDTYSFIKFSCFY